jgi:CRP-like cAMP-binding protein
VKRIIGPGDFFGDQAILYNVVRTATVTALDDLTCFSLERGMVKNTLGT